MFYKRHRAEAAIRLQRGVEIVYEIFMGQIADRANAVERQIQVFGGPRHPRRFHFYYRCAGGAQVAFFRSRLRNVVNGGDDTCRGVRSLGEECGPDISAVSNLRGDKDVANLEGFVKGSAESDIADGGGFRGHKDSGECALGSGAVGNGGDFAAFPAAGSGPMHGELEGLNLFPVGEQAGAFAGVRGDEEEGLLHECDPPATRSPALPNHFAASERALVAGQGE